MEKAMPIAQSKRADGKPPRGAHSSPVFLALSGAMVGGGLGGGWPGIFIGGIFGFAVGVWGNAKGKAQKPND